MSDSPNKRAVIVGIFILFGLIFLGAGILVIGNLHDTFTRKIRIVTVLQDVSGLQTGNNIWFSGVKVGTVKAIEFYGKDQVKVIMKIDRDVRPYIKKDAKVKISTDGLIGNKIIVIYGGSEKTPPVDSGDTLGIEVTVSTEDMLTTLQANNQNFLEITNDLKVITKKLANGEGSIGKLLNDEDIYQEVRAATRSLGAASAQAQQVAQSLAAFTAKLNKKGTMINDLVTDTSTFGLIRQTLYNLKITSDSISGMVSELKAASANTSTPMGVLLRDEKAGADLKSTIKNLETGSKKLDEDLEALQHSFLMRKYFKNKEKEAKKKEKEEKKKAKQEKKGNS